MFHGSHQILCRQQPNAFHQRNIRKFQRTRTTFTKLYPCLTNLDRTAATSMIESEKYEVHS